MNAVWYHPKAWAHIYPQFKTIFEPATIEMIMAGTDFGVTNPPSKLIGQILDSYIFLYDGTALWGAVQT